MAFGFGGGLGGDEGRLLQGRFHGFPPTLQRFGALGGHPRVNEGSEAVAPAAKSLPGGNLQLARPAVAKIDGLESRETVVLPGKQMRLPHGGSRLYTWQVRWRPHG